MMKDISAVLAALVMTGAGKLLGISALSWVGAILFLTALVGIAMAREKKNYMTPLQAAVHLKAKYRATAP